MGMALSLTYTVPFLEERALHAEFVPERSDYIPEDSSDGEPFIAGPNTYFEQNLCACYAVRLLKHLFQGTLPRMKSCTMEQLVQQMHSKVSIQHPAHWREDSSGTKHLFLLCLKQIEEQPEFRAMAKMITEVYPDGLPKLSIPSGISLSEVRRDPELSFRDVPPLRCSPERAWRALSPLRRRSSGQINHSNCVYAVSPCVSP